ncbi:hypothetical protein [Natronorubrum texcoconense]|uniref:Right handed beta helix region n=1 Tax=Natronorubrum texcoconense TaxID=1095776 RepID=A0A1G9G320_9EURY|nr:hypothetical protein [Natronorubrum texcoconense]SDK94977.1 hypothetical protein SAMN04515672_4396 [Natronorubrum texcoconense]
MARESSVPDDDRCVGDELSSTSNDETSELLGRRSYMKLAGATTAAAAVFSTGASADDGDYDVIEARGQVIRIGNETFENKLVDVSNGNGITFVVDGAATIRNIGISGLYQGDGFIFSITAPRGTVEFENIYIGDGANKSGSSFVHGPGAIFYHASASADVVFRECNVQGYPNNGWYCSNSSRGGSVTWERCFGKNNGVTTFRAASGGDTLRDCVAYNDNTDYSTEYGSWGNYNESSGRPLWVWQPGGCTVEDCHFDAGQYNAAVITHHGASVALDGGAVAGGTQGRVNTSNAGSSPDLSIPDGVPTSAEQAASGESDSGSDGGSEPDEEELEHTLLFDGDASDVTRYEFSVDGDVEPSNYEGATIDDAAGIEDAVAHGVVADWRDAFRFSGELEALTVDGPATVLLDDEEIDPADYGEDLPHVLEVEGQGEPTSFEITVDGTIELDSEDEPEDEATTISGSTVQSSVTDDSLTFRFSGALTDVSIIDGEAAVSLDDEEIDPDDFGDHELLPHALVIDGTQDEEPSAYSFEASGAVFKSTYQDATIDANDVIEGRTVRGVVDDHLDAYWFEGGIEDFTLRGRAEVDVQYNVRNQ